MTITRILGIATTALLVLTPAVLVSVEPADTRSPAEKIGAVTYEDLIPFWEAAIVSDPQPDDAYTILYECWYKSERIAEVYRRHGKEGGLRGELAHAAFERFWHHDGPRAGMPAVVKPHALDEGFPRGIFSIPKVRQVLEQSLNWARDAAIEALAAQTAEAGGPPSSG